MNFKIIGENIRKRRKLAHLTQKQLAEKIKKAESSIQKYEAGKVEIPFSVLEDIANALNVEMIDLVDDFTFMEMQNNTDFSRDDYLISLGYQIAIDSTNSFATIRYNGYSYKIPIRDYLELLNDIDHCTHYTVDKLLEKNTSSRHECNDYMPIIKHRFKASVE